MTSTVAVCAAATGPAVARGRLRESAVIESGAIVAPLRVPVTATRMPGCMSVGAIGMSSSTPLRRRPGASVQMKRLVPPSK